MYSSKKVWVIDTKTSEDPWEAGQRKREKTREESVSSEYTHAAAIEGKHSSGRSAWHIVLAYALGPLTLVFMRRSRGGLIWASLGLLSIAAWTAFLANRPELLGRAQMTSAGVISLIAALSVVTLLGFIAWGLAVLEAGRGNRFIRERLRGPLPHPALIAVFGLLFPGLGLLITGHPRRAAWAMGMVGPLAAAVAILAHAPWLVQLNRSREPRMPGRELELILLFSLLLALVAALAWLVQGLEGLRHAARLSGRMSQGTPFALALLLALAAFAIAFKPGRVAQDLDRFAVVMRLDGLQVIPLCMEIGAMHFDPSIPLYAARAAELYEELGMPENARSIREDLWVRWRSVAQSLERKGRDPLWRP